LRGAFFLDCGTDFDREIGRNLLKSVSALRMLGRPGHYLSLVLALNDGLAARHEISAPEFLGHLVFLPGKSYRRGVTSGMAACCGELRALAHREIAGT
jgi:hypothetical protein